MRLTQFKVTGYRNIRDSGWVDVDDITVFIGQNEAGKSNLFEALYRINPFAPNEHYDIDEDWPVDDWGNKDPAACVCQAKFSLTPEDLTSLHAAAALNQEPAITASSQLTLLGMRSYSTGSSFTIEGADAAAFDAAKVEAWARQHVPRFVLIQEYGFSGKGVDLAQFTTRLKQADWHQLTHEEQTVKTMLDLVGVDVDTFLAKGDSAEGRTTRFFDKRAASAYLSKQFRALWTQKPVDFHLEIDGTTLNIFAEDESVGMPVRLHRRSTGFRWLAAFAWKFTQASQGRYKNCILLLEEPGIHLHHAGQRDLLALFQRLAAANTILYTTHLPALIEPAHPERVRIVETEHDHAVVRHSVVSSQRAPMAVIEQALGLTGDMSALFGTRQILIVENGDEALILQKLSGVLRSVAKAQLTDRLLIWPAQGAGKTALYAAFAIGQGWDAGALLSSDTAGREAQAHIDALLRDTDARGQSPRFRVFMLGDAAGMQKEDAAIEDLFDNQFYLDCVNTALGLAIRETDLPEDGSDKIAARVERVLIERYGHPGLDRRRVMTELLRRADGWEKLSDLPKGTASRAEKLFTAINGAFGRRGEAPMSRFSGST